MTWPTPQDYNEAIQSPRLAFDDSALQSGTPELTPLGLPRPITGNFASVYRLHCAGRDLAVRCFWRELSDMQERYSAISDHLRATKLPYTVGFEYLPRGIRIRGHWYPILKMEWVQGKLLGEYVEEHLLDRGALLELARRWITMVETLSRASVAHGDLQHGNILVVNGELKLVDYDGMFVPALNGRQSHELGHPNYQHPRRTGNHFDLSVDRFSALVIYLSLLALSADPAVWTAANGGDECLLLRKKDFDAPGTSPALQNLEGSADLEVRRLAAELRSYLNGDPSQLPSLSELVGERTQDSASRRFPGIAIPWRLRIRQPVLLPQPALSGAHAGSTVPVGPPMWVQEAISTPQREDVAFGASILLPRRFVLLSWLLLLPALLLANITAVLAWQALAALLLLVVILDLVVLFVCFRRDPSVGAMRSLIREEKEQLRRLKSINREARRWEGRRARLDARYDGRRASLDAKKNRLGLSVRRTQQQAFSRIGDLLRDLESELHEVDRQERDALNAALAAIQERHLRDCLRRSSLLSASIPELNRRSKLRLWLRGIRTAADVTSARTSALKQLEKEQAAAVLVWRASIQAHAKRTRPRHLPPDREDRVAVRYRRCRRSLLSDVERLVVRQRFIADVLTGLHEVQRAALDRKLEEARTQYLEGARQLDIRIARVREDEPFHHRQLAQLREELEVFRGLTFWRYLSMVIGHVQVS